MKRSPILIVVFCLAVGSAWAAVPVSPGEADSSPALAGRCTGFSWAPDRDAVSQRLLVFELANEQAAAFLAAPSDSGLAEPTLDLELPAGAGSWTPSAGNCAQRGGHYGWIVGSIDRKGATSWSAPLFFSVSAMPSKAEIADAMEVLRLASTGGAPTAVEGPVGDDLRASQAAVDPPAEFGVDELVLSSDAEVNMRFEATGSQAQVWDIQTGSFGMNISDLTQGAGTVLGMDAGTGDVSIGGVSPDFDFHIERAFASSGINAGSSFFTTTSSRKLKENIRPLAVENILEKVAAVQVKTYDWKSEMFGGEEADRTDRMGLIAEDFYTILGRGSDEMIDGQELQMVLWLAVQELTQKIEELQAGAADPIPRSSGR